MQLIETCDELQKNLSYLDRIRQSAAGDDQEVYRALIARGRVLLPYLTNGAVAFAPSRFIGYADNTLETHQENEERDGTKTNTKIARVLRDKFRVRIENESHEGLETKYAEFCDAIGASPWNLERTYWVNPEIATHLAQPDTGSVRDAAASQESQVLSNAALPKTTREAMVQARVGHGMYRNRVLSRYGCCLITGIEEPALLIASHIKPWSACRDNPEECLSADNALLLTPTWDRLFDRGLISFTDDGHLLVSRDLSKDARARLQLRNGLKVSLTPGQVSYLQYHRSLHGYPH